MKRSKLSAIGWNGRFRFLGWTLLIACLGIGLAPSPVLAQPNAIVVENALTGNPSSEWDISGAGDASIQGFATEISVDQGDTVYFKVDTDATDYRLDIYRMGYYGGMGARKVATVEPSATLPQIQPACTYVDSTKLLDCGTWAVSASWAVPDTATSGIYFAKLVREDPEDGRSSHVVFIVRDDDGGSALLFKTSDTTWQAYNRYGDGNLFGGASLYTGPSGKADKVSYNRPYTTRGVPTEDWVMNAAYPMVRWLERNGYDVSYFTDVDCDRFPAELLEHEIFLSVGHDEYWSREERTAVETAREAGVHLAFFSGNEIYWKTRWENSIDGSGTPFRTLVCYKEGALGESQCGVKCDPDSTVWTGLWRSGCSYTPPADGCEPENALSGQISWVGSTGSIEVPYAYKDFPIWRNTSITNLLPESPPATFPYGTLGYEWDFEQYEEYYPPGRIKLSETTLGGRTHQLSLYRHTSGALVFGAGTVQWSWGLDSNHDRGSAPEDVRMQQATVNLLGDMGVDPETIQGNLVLASPSSDTTPPTSVITSPTAGASVESGSLFTVTGTASDAGGGIVALVEVSVDSGLTWQVATGTDNWTYNWYPGAPGSTTVFSRAIDNSLNWETPGSGVGVTIDPRVCPCGIWSLAATPDVIDNADTNPIEVGVRFQSDIDGYVTGMRFYKTVNNTGTHTGNLWNNAGTNLGTVTFSGESASGWQEAVFDAPIAITADTTYVISYHTTTGYYALDEYYFTPTGVDNPPLRALADGEDGDNGIYIYSAVPAFPTTTWHSANYWVDVVFNETAVDTIPPTVQSRVPSAGSSGISITTTITAVFNEAVVESTIVFELRDSVSVLVPAGLSYDAPTRTATLTPSASLDHTAEYTATVSGAEDLSANAMAAPDVWTFTTGTPPPPPPDEGPGGPILVVGDAANPFGRYFAEILRTEGLNYFNATDISLVTPTSLLDYDVVILGEMALSAGDVTMLSDWVTAGGKLIAMRPDKQLAGLLGLTDAASTLAEGYLLLDTASGPGVGLVDETIQFHGAADLYTLNGATVLATLYSDATTATTNPAVTLNSVGGSGGQAAAFTFDLARSVVYTRQGNPAWEGQERDGTAPLRSDDMFYGAAAGDPQPDWIDLNKVAIPQADEQQRFLARLITQMEDQPLPRFWYFPSGHKAVVIMTGDHHGCCGGTTGRWDIYLANDPPGCSVDDWECIRGSSYIYPGSGLTDAQALYYHNLGFELGIHVNTGCANWTPAQLAAFYSSQLATFGAQFPSLPIQSSERTHCISWADWVTQAKVKLTHGIRLDTNYYYWPPGWVADRPGMFTGSGMPMRFGDLDGTMIDVYQAVSQMTDESGQSYPYTIDTLLDRALGSEEYFGAFCANMHTDNAISSGSVAIVASAQARGVPVVSGRQMLTWLDGRNSSSFDSLSWNGSVLSFDVLVGTGATNMRGMVPTVTPVGVLTTLTWGGVPLAYTTETIKGVEYAFFPAEAGSYEGTFAPDLTPPVITNLAAAPETDGTAEITWDTDEQADSKVDFGTHPDSLTSTVANATQILAHSINLSGLTANTTYYYRATSVDGALNSTTEPLPPAAPASFTTPPPVCFTDLSLTDFSAGNPDTSIYLAETDDGEVILSPTEGTEFDGTTIPTGWTATPWVGGGTAVVGGGVLTLDGAWVGADPLYTSGRSVEFVATFQAAIHQHAGFSVDLTGSGWAIFSTSSGGSDLQARTSTGASTSDTGLGTSYFGSPHLYRIDWNAASVDFYIDGSLVHSEAVTITESMRPIASDQLAGPTLVVDWMRLSDYDASGSFSSRVYDAGGTANWGPVTWTGQEPAGTSVSIFIRTGNTPIPDSTWTTYTAVPSSGTTIGGSSQYIQYRADLATTDSTRTPALEDLSVSCDTGPDTNPPILLSTAPVDQATDVAIGTDITLTYNEPINPSTFNATISGGVSFTPSFTGGNVSVILNPDVDLGYLTAYTVTVDPGVEDTLGNATVGAVGIDFTTVAAPALCLIDETRTDFNLGTFDSGIYLSEMSNGEVVLAPTAGAEFDGVSLPAGWGSVNWDPSGSVTVSGGSVTVDAARVRTDALYSAGHSLEFLATFAAGAGNRLQHGGFGGGGDTAPETYNSAPWAMFSTGLTGGTQLQARVWDGGTQFDTTLPGSYLGAPHRYRIDWGTTSIEFFIDGALVHSETITITAGDMRPAFSDLDLGAPSFSVDWMRISPYSVSGSLTSRVLDAGEAVDWGQATWTSTDPVGTTLSLFARTGNTPVPGPAWTAFSPVAASGDPVGGNSRYIQYRADLGTTDTDETPVLEDVEICYTTVASDTAPPEVRTHIPGDGETDVAVAANVTAVFSEALDPLSLVDTTFTVTPQGGGSAVAAVVTFDAGTLTGTLNPTADLAPGTTYDARITTLVTDVAGNPMVADTVWSFTTLGIDLTPPDMASTLPLPSASDVAVGSDITATFTEAMNPATITGTTFTLAPQAGGPAVSALVTYDGGSFTATLNPDADLSYGTVYEARVTTGAEDLAANPLNSDYVWTFATEVLAGICAEDDTLGDFAAGTPDAGIYLSETDDGEAILTPTAGSEFNGTALPAGWSSAQWTGGLGSTVVGGGGATMSGTRIQTDAAYGSGRALEFVATFNGGANQHVGFSDDFASRWVIFSGKTSPDRVYARVNPGGSDVDLGTGFVGTPHLYRIEWNSGATNTIDFYIDGGLVNSQTVGALGVMSPIASDFTSGDATLLVDWMRLSDYGPSGSFTSRVFDAGVSSTWGNATWTSTLPTGTSLAVYARTGEVAVPDGSWTPYTLIASSGSSVDSVGQFLQYRADLATTDPMQTPILSDLSIECIPEGPDLNPPVISGLTATPGANGTTATIDWTTNENADSRVDYGTDPGALVLSSVDPADVTTHSLALTGLLPGTTYYYRATSADPSDNETTEPPTGNPAASFTTPLLPCAVDMTSADFSAGSLTDVHVSETTDGELILAYLEGSEFEGTGLPAGWSSTPWSGGTSTVAGGTLTVDGARANPAGLFAPGRSLEFVATFGAQSFQSIGFGLTFNESLWAMFGTRTSSSTLYATTHDGTTLNDIALGAYLGAPHLYRIEWNPASVDFYIDGGLVASDPVTIADSMRPIVSDFTNGGAVVAVDWLRMTPYTSSGSFASRVFDGGGPTTWAAVNWDADLPAGTTLDMSVRTGDTPVPDGSWVTTPVPTSGTNLGIVSRYIQYLAGLGTSDVTQTPSLKDVSITCSPVGAGNSILPVSPGACLSTTTTCVAVPVTIDRTDNTGIRTASVTFALSSELAFCTGDPSPGVDVREGTYLSSIGTTVFGVQDNGNGTYTADISIQGLPCGAIDSTGTLFEVDVTNTIPDGNGTLSVISVVLLDCNDDQIPSAAGTPALVSIDHTPPAAIAGLAATQVKTGVPPGSTPGTTAITLSWAPAEAGATITAYRKGFGDYPEYDDGIGAPPAAPADTGAALADGWLEVGTTGGSSLTDAPATRDFWYYVAFVADTCGNLSSVSSPLGGALNYHLGDVSDGVTPGDGDGVVNLFDVSSLGDAYGTGDGELEYQGYLDVGPTTDLSADALPTTDDVIQFEDLILFAVNFEPSGPAAPGVTPVASADRNELSIHVPSLPPVGQTFEAAVHLASDGRIQGISVALDWDGTVVEPTGVAPGPWMQQQLGQSLVLSPKPGTIDAAVLGSTMSGEGVLATMTFRVIGEGDPGVWIADLLARDASNRPVDVPGQVLAGTPPPSVIPAVTRLLPSAPNPFTGATTISFDLARRARVVIHIYNVSGELVFKFFDKQMPPGTYQFPWTGRDDTGRRVPAGLYLVRLVTPGHVETQRVIRLR